MLHASSAVLFILCDHSSTQNYVALYLLLYVSYTSHYSASCPIIFLGKVAVRGIMQGDHRY